MSGSEYNGSCTTNCTNLSLKTMYLKIIYTFYPLYLLRGLMEVKCRSHVSATRRFQESLHIHFLHICLVIRTLKALLSLDSSPPPWRNDALCVTDYFLEGQRRFWRAHYSSSKICYTSIVSLGYVAAHANVSVKELVWQFCGETL